MPVLTFSEALATVQEYASRLSPTDPELVSLLDSLKLALAEDLVADRDFPPFPRGHTRRLRCALPGCGQRAGTGAMRRRAEGRSQPCAEFGHSAAGRDG